MYLVKNISKTFKKSKNDTVNALKEVSLKLDDTGFVALTGKSGCGKSTLLSILGTLDDFDSGTVCFGYKGKSINFTDLDARDIDSFRNSSLGFVFQDYNLINEWTVSDNLKIVLDQQLADSNQDELIRKTLIYVGLDGLENRYIKELSGGQQQRVAIARAIIKKPMVLLADEPTGNLDSESSNEILEILKKYSAECLVFMVTHDVQEAEKYVDRIIKMKDGKIESDISLRDTGSNEKLICNETKEICRIKQSRCFKLAINSLLIRKLKLFLTVFILAILIFIFKLSVSILYNDYGKALYRQISEEKTEFVAVYSKESIADRNGFDSVAYVGNSSSLQNLFRENKLLDFVSGVTTQVYASSNNFEGLIPVEISIDGIIPEKIEFIGTVPQNSNQVVVSDYLTEKLGVYGEKIGQTIYLYDVPFVISGIICFHWDERSENKWTNDDVEYFTKYCNRVVVSKEFNKEMLKSKMLFLSFSELRDNKYLTELFNQKVLFRPVSSITEEYEFIWGKFPESTNEIALVYSYADNNQCLVFEGEDYNDWLKFNNWHGVEQNGALSGYLNVYDYYPNVKISGVLDIKNWNDETAYVITDDSFDVLLEVYWNDYFANYYELNIRDLRPGGNFYNTLINNDFVLDTKAFDQIILEKSNWDAYDTILKVGLCMVSLLIILFLVLFISVNVRDNYKKIGILKSLGVCDRDVQKIWNIESLILCIVSYCIGSLGNLIAIGFMNCKIRTHSSLTCNVIQENYGYGSMELLALVLISFILVAVPIWNITEKKPMQLLRIR